MSKIEIESAFVEAWSKNNPQHPSWGMKIAEPHRRKNDQGEFETVARTYRTVKVSRDSGIDLTGFAVGDRVTVTGREVTEVREHEGRKYFDLVVWADSVARAGAGRAQGAEQGGGWGASPGQSSGVHEAPSGWSGGDDQSTPF